MKLLTLRESSGLALSDAEDAVMALARTAVRPIYRNKGQRPEQIGSCTFVEIDGVDYLMTAAHVIDNHEQHTLFVGQKGLVPVNLTFLSTAPPSGKRSRDKIDFAFARVDANWRDKGIRPLPISALLDREDAPFYSAIGYPNSCNRRYNPTKNTVRPTVRQFLSIPTREASTFRAIGLSNDMHLALRRPSKYGHSSGKRVRLFEPRGMSGGMIFGLYGLHRAGVVGGLESPLIVPEAIITEKNTSHQLLFGTRLGAIIEVIRCERHRAWQR